MKRLGLISIGLLLTTLLLSTTVSIADEIEPEPWEKQIFATYGYLWRMAAIGNPMLMVLAPPKFSKFYDPSYVAYQATFIVKIKSKSDCENHSLYWTEERRKAFTDICYESILSVWHEIESIRRQHELEPAGYMLSIVGGCIGNVWSEMRYIESKDIKVERDEPETPSKPDSWT